MNLKLIVFKTSMADVLARIARRIEQRSESFAKLNDFTYIVKTDHDVGDIVNELMVDMDEERDDFVFVVDITDDRMAAGNFPREAIDWIRSK